jgi:SAM-dependent methyltransferase
MSVDARTAAAYSSHAAAYADDWLSQPPPTDLQETIRRYFRRGVDGGKTADIGCGSGRDVDWSNRNGYPCTGFEPNDALRDEAQARFPEWAFAAAELPDLVDIASQSFDNVLCETVIMHLPIDSIAAAVRGLCRIVAARGTLYLSWRVTDRDERDARGRLYSAFDVALVERALDGMAVLRSEEAISASSGKRIHALVARSN